MAKKRKTRTQTTPAAKTLSQAAFEKKQSDNKERITPREAAIAANRYYCEVTGDNQQATVEEIELNQAGNRWLVTLGFRTGIGFIAPSLHKAFEVDAYTGEVRSMKIREL